jgi:hypothetical protein
MLVLTPEDVGNGALIETNYGNIEVVFNCIKIFELLR